LSWKAAWNDGIVECWKTGPEKREKVYSKKNAVFAFNDDTHVGSPFLTFAQKIRHNNEKINTIIFVLIF